MSMRRGTRALNDWLERRCVALWSEVRHPEQAGRTIADVWTDEQPHLMKMPPPFDGSVESIKRVSPTWLIVFERNRYSVPAAFANRPASVRVYAYRVLIAAEGRWIHRSSATPEVSEEGLGGG